MNGFAERRKLKNRAEVEGDGFYEVKTRWYRVSMVVGLEDEVKVVKVVAMRSRR